MRNARRRLYILSEEDSDCEQIQWTGIVLVEKSRAKWL